MEVGNKKTHRLTGNRGNKLLEAKHIKDIFNINGKHDDKHGDKQQIGGGHTLI